MTASVSVGFLLLPGLGDERLDALRSALDELGLVERIEGRRSWSVRVEPTRFEALFGVRVSAVPPRPPASGDKGQRGGYVCDEEPRVPEALRPFIESVGVEPPMTRFGR